MIKILNALFYDLNHSVKNSIGYLALSVKGKAVSLTKLCAYASLGGMLMSISLVLLCFAFLKGIGFWDHHTALSALFISLLGFIGSIVSLYKIKALISRI